MTRVLDQWVALMASKIWLTCPPYIYIKIYLFLFFIVTRVWTGGDWNSVDMFTRFVFPILALQLGFWIDGDRNLVNLSTHFFPFFQSLHCDQGFGLMVNENLGYSGGHQNSVDLSTFFSSIATLQLGFQTRDDQKSCSLGWWPKFDQYVHLFFLLNCNTMTKTLNYWQLKVLVARMTTEI